MCIEPPKFEGWLHAWYAFYTFSKWDLSDQNLRTRLRSHLLKSIEGFLMYMHYTHVGAIPTVFTDAQHTGIQSHVCFL